MIGPTAAELAEAIAAEREAIAAGQAALCAHESVTGLPCVRADRHEPPHALQLPGDLARISQMLTDRAE